MCEQWFDVAFGFVCRSYPQCRVRRDDFLQEAHLYIIGRLQERIGEDGILDLDSGPPFSRWVRRRLLNSCLNLARKESRRTAATSADPELVETVPARSDDDPYGIIEEQVAALHACIEALPAELRDVAGYVRDEPGITLTEIARRLDRSVATASNRYQQIITLLRHCLGRRGIT